MNVYQKLLFGIRRKVAGTGVRMTYAADGFGVRKKFVPFLGDKEFSDMWKEVCADNDPHWFGETPDIRWRAHVCIWAASNCLRIPGDFAEFGVNTGILSSAVMKIVDVDRAGKKFFLFDTFEGIPEQMATQTELKKIRNMNKALYSGDSLGTAIRVFSKHECAEIVQGILPESISKVDFDALSYVSIDLNSVNAEMAVIEAIWDRITPGGIIVLDDYGFAGHEEQNKAWNEFAFEKNRVILAVPTGQGVLVR